MIVPLAAVAFLLGACSSDADALAVVDEVPELRLTAELDGTPVTTRAAATLQTTAIVNSQKVGVFLRDNLTTATTYSGTYDTNHTNLEYTAGANNALTPASAQYFPADGNKIKIYAYAPRQSSWNLTGTNNWECKTDQTSQANYLASDLISGSPATNPVDRNTTSKSIVFKHALTRVTVELVAGNGMNLSNVSAVNLLGIKYKGTVKMASNVVSTTTSDFTPNSTTSAINLMKNSTWPVSGTYSSSAVVFPNQTIAKDADFIQVVTGDYTFTYKMAAATLFASGTEYKYTITLNNLGLTVTATINAWSTTTTNGSVTFK